MAFAIVACSKPPPPEPPPLRHKPLLSPQGVPDVTTVSDEFADRPGRVAVEARLLAPKGIGYQQIEWLLDSVHRQAASRRGFKNAGRPQAVDIRVYDDERATGSPERYIARVRSEGGDPVVEIRIPYPLGAEVNKMLDERPDFIGIRPRAKAEDAAGKLVVTVPFVDGRTDDYLPKVSYVRALQEWSSWTLDLFAKYPALLDLTFVGVHRGAELVRVEVTRAQFSEIGLRGVEEDIGAFQGGYLGGIMSGEISEAAVQRKVDARRKQAYRQVLAKLPREQVSVAASLR